MKLLFIFVVLCTAQFVTLDAAPVLQPSLPSSFETAGEQWSLHEIAKTFSRATAASKSGLAEMMENGKLQSDKDKEIGLSFMNMFSKILSAMSTKANPNDKVVQTILNAGNTLFSIMRKSLEEGEIQSRDKVVQTLMTGEVQSAEKEFGRTFFNVVGNILSAMGRKVDPNDEAVQSVISGLKQFFSILGKVSQDGEIQSSDEIMQTLMNLDTGEVQSADKETGRLIFDVVSSLLSAISKKADPKDEVAQTFLGGFNTILSLLRKQVEQGGEIQSSDEMMQALMNLETGETESFDGAMPAFLKLFGNVLSVVSKNIDPNDDVARSFLNGISSILSAAGGKLSGGGSEIQSDDEIVSAFFNLMSNFLSIASKRVDPNNKVAQAVLPAFKKLFSVFAKDALGGGLEIQSNDEMKQTVANLISSVISALTKKIENGEIQSDSELPKTVLNVFSTLASALQKKVNPKDEMEKSFFNLFNTILSAAKTKIGDSQELQVAVETLPYATKQVGQSSMVELMDENVAMMEAYTELSDEAKAQFWRMLIGNLASGLMNRFLDG